jgi:hypothetical protein
MLRSVLLAAVVVVGACHGDEAKKAELDDKLAKLKGEKAEKADKADKDKADGKADKGKGKPSFASDQVAAGAGSASTPAGAGSGAAPGAAPGAGSGAAPGAKVVKPPSTGAEMIKPKIKPPTRDEARTVLASALTAATNKQCELATKAVVQTALDFAEVDPELIKANEAGFLALARCAEGAKFYHFMNAVALDIYRADPKYHPELLARAMLGLGEFKISLEILKRAAKASPKDGDILVTIAKAACKLEAWKECLKAADTTLKTVGAPTTKEKKEIAWRADKYRARALLHTGKFAEATRAATTAEKLGGAEHELDEIQKLAASGARHKMLVESTFSPSIPLGGYHLFGKIAKVGSVATLKVSNMDKKPAEVRIEAEISGVTERAGKTVTVLPGKTETVELNPPLKTSFDVGSIRADMTGQLALRVTRTDVSDVVYDESEPVTMLPRDTLPLLRHMRDGQARWTSEFIGAWVTPNAKSVDEFLAAAKKRLPAGTSFSGGQAPTLPQVKAIYDELHERGMSYVMDPDLFVDGADLVQRTRLPSDVLATTNAQCIEGALLYATLLEAIGLRPVVTLAKGHSWVGWHPEGHDTPPSRAPKLFWLETTVTSKATFEQALATGDDMFYVRHIRDWAPPPRGALGYGWVDIAELRAHGITPQPWDR